MSGIYRIYSAIRLGFPFSRMATNNKISPKNVAIIQALPCVNSPKDLDPSSKMDLDFQIVLEGKKTLSYNRRNMVIMQMCRLNIDAPECGI